MDRSLAVIVFGLPGSGKSYFAERLSRRIGGVYLSSDKIRRQLFAVRRYTPEEKAAVYQAMIEKAIAQSGILVLDATFHTQAVRDRFREALRDRRVVFIEVRADEDITLKRLGKPREYSEADESVHRMLSAEWEDMEEEHLILHSTDDNIDDMIVSALRHLGLST